ncbi:DUF262 domain-containing protein [Fodinicola feengrottensis]|uniref:DUF262 domain-containing protein n=1 Tax=Fodinicola feengrottensis TaxID=435914 RepID=A0ABP4V570_9ACTN|nr:DUF262 domain-containing protein [Fodinicola feengrottensis]
MPTLDRPRIEYRTPDDLVGEVQRGLIRIPTFQRSFKWEARDVVMLFDSIFRGYPIGNILLWRRPAPKQRLTIGPLVIDAPETDSALWVVDGQQRITSLVGALVDAETSSDSRFRVHLDLDNAEFHTAGARQVPPRSWIPVSKLLDTRTYLRWVRDNREWLTEDNLSLGDSAAKAIREYQIPTYVVTSADEEPLVEIFARMNSQGKRLRKDEVFQALHSSRSGDGPSTLKDLENVTASLGFGALDNRLALRCVLAFRGGDIFREDFKEEFLSPEDRADTFRNVSESLLEVVRFLQQDALIPHIRLLPYSHFVPVLTRFVGLFGQPEGRAATLLRRWVWRGAVAGTRARGISVADVRNQVESVSGKDPVESAMHLLRLVNTPPEFTVELDKVHFNHAITKINVLGMLASDPHDLLTGASIDIPEALRSGSPLVAVLADTEVPDGLKLANRIVTERKYPDAQRRLTLAPAEVRESHLVDAVALGLLKSGSIEEFTAYRGEALSRAIRWHVSQMAEWGARDAHAVSDLMRRAV